MNRAKASKTVALTSNAHELKELARHPNRHVQHAAIFKIYKLIGLNSDFLEEELRARLAVIRQYEVEIGTYENTLIANERNEAHNKRTKQRIEELNQKLVATKDQSEQDELNKKLNELRMQPIVDAKKPARPNYAYWTIDAVSKTVPRVELEATLFPVKAETASA